MNRQLTVTLDLGEAINQEHRHAARSAQEAVQHARNCGDLLLKAKEAVKHGAWLRWVETYCEFTPRTAQSYMKLAEGWPTIQAKYETVSHLSFGQALRILSENRPKLSPEFEALAACGPRFEELAYRWQGRPTEEWVDEWHHAFHSDLLERLDSFAKRFGEDLADVVDFYNFYVLRPLDAKIREPEPFSKDCWLSLLDTVTVDDVLHWFNDGWRPEGFRSVRGPEPAPTC